MRTIDSILKILLVDDEPFIRKGLNALIDWEAEGYCITGEASNGKNAIQLLRKNQYDLIISDIKMPDMDGIELFTNVKKNNISEAKFVFLSGFYDFQYAKTAIQYGCYDYILKPIQKDELLELIRKIMREHQKVWGKTKNKKIFEKSNLNTNSRELIIDISNLAIQNSQKEYYRKEIDQLIHAIDVGDKSMIDKNIRYFYHLIMEQYTNSELIDLNIQYFLYRLLGLAYEQDPNISHEEVIQYIRDAVFSMETIHVNEVKFSQFVKEYSEYLMQLRQNNTKGTISQIEMEIEEKYADNLSLKSLGEKYYMNSAYLGQIFKKQYGCTFKDYLNGVRIRKAAEMLIHTDEKMYVIAEKVGYKNLEYFINKFENVYGYTPTRFRKRNQIK
jgi:YesN/AraC family two-component response regulator